MRLSINQLVSKLNEVTERHVAELERVLGASALKVTSSLREQYARDEGHFRSVAPSLVVCPLSVPMLSDTLRYCHLNRLPVVPYGTGTGLEGGSISLQGGVCISTLEIEGGVTMVNEESADCSTRPSVTRKQLNDVIRHTGLFFPVDPGADASLCGMAATGASGTNAVRYGTVKENVINMEVVLADGTVIHTRGEGRRPRKSSAGLNLTELFVGSEGVLGIISEVTLRLHPRPLSQSAAVVPFPTVSDAVSAVVQILQSAIPIARIELLDDCQIAACNSYSTLSLQEAATLFLEFHGSNEDEVESQTQAVEEICEYHQRLRFESSLDTVGMERLWTARHNAYYAALALRKGCTGFTTDVCVPIDRLAVVVVETKKDLVETGLVGTIVGHVGDGNFHVILPVNKEDSEEMERVKMFSDRLVRRALSANGTCTGEHGIGIGKLQYLEEELGPAAIGLTKTIKQALDPHGIMNPGKVVRL